MTEPDINALIREAAEIFLRLRDKPEDEALQRERDAFLARGAAERAAYAKMLHAWNASNPGAPKVSKAKIILGIAVVAALGFGLAAEPLQSVLFADVSTGREPVSLRLESGDLVALDAETAIVDETDGAVRSVRVLHGAAYFDVTPEPRTFAVSAGDIRVEVTGTAFEVAHLDDGARVSVAEGAVTVRVSDETWDLTSGDQLIWAESTGGALQTVDPTTTASWREDRLVADGMRFGEIMQAVERRLAGDVWITDAALAATPITGVFDLSDPQATLTLLSELTGARVTQVPYVMTIISP